MTEPSFPSHDAIAAAGQSRGFRFVMFLPPFPSFQRMNLVSVNLTAKGERRGDSSELRDPPILSILSYPFEQSGSGGSRFAEFITEEEEEEGSAVPKGMRREFSARRERSLTSGRSAK